MNKRENAYHRGRVARREFRIIQKLLGNITLTDHLPFSPILPNVPQEKTAAKASTMNRRQPAASFWFEICN
jgi:hypothetical protein